MTARARGKKAPADAGASRIAKRAAAAPRWLQTSTKDEILAHAADQQDTIAALRRELSEARAESVEDRKRLEAFADINHAVHLLAARRLAADVNKPKTPPNGEDGLPLFDHRDPPTRFERRERHRATTFPQALTMVLEGLAFGVEAMRLRDNERDDFEGQIADLEAERDTLLRAIGMDDHAWGRISWKY